MHNFLKVPSLNFGDLA